MLTDISTAVVDVERDHHEWKYREYIDESAIVVPYFEIEEQNKAD